MKATHLAFFFFLVCATLLPSLSRAAAPPILQGLDLAQGKPAEITLAKAKRGTVMVFVSSHCPCSASHEAVLKNLAAEYGPQGFQFVGIHSNQDESIADAQAHFKSAALPFAVIQDPGAKIADAMGALKTPHVFILNPQGETLYQGGVDDSHQAEDARKHYLQETLTALSEGKKPARAQTRALGCLIARK